MDRKNGLHRAPFVIGMFGVVSREEFFVSCVRNRKNKKSWKEKIKSLRVDLLLRVVLGRGLDGAAFVLFSVSSSAFI